MPKNVYHDTPDYGPPTKVGGLAVSADITACAGEDRAHFICDTLGKQVELPYSIPARLVSGVNSATGTADTSVIAAQGAGIRIYVTSISVANSSATNAYVEIKDGTTVIWRLTAPATNGSSQIFPCALRLTANTALNMASSAGVTTMFFAAAGYIATN